MSIEETSWETKTRKEWTDFVVKELVKTKPEEAAATIAEWWLARLSRVREETREKLLAEIPEDMPCEEPGRESPEDPEALLAADQARNFTLRQWRKSLESLGEANSTPHE